MTLPLGQATHALGPLQDVGALPDRAGGDTRHRFWEVGALGQLTDALGADTEEFGDLGNADKVDFHRHTVGLD